MKKQNFGSRKLELAQDIEAIELRKDSLSGEIFQLTIERDSIRNMAFQDQKRLIYYQDSLVKQEKKYLNLEGEHQNNLELLALTRQKRIAFENQELDNRKVISYLHNSIDTLEIKLRQEYQKSENSRLTINKYESVVGNQQEKIRLFQLHEKYQGSIALEIPRSYMDDRGKNTKTVIDSLILFGPNSLNLKLEKAVIEQTFDGEKYTFSFNNLSNGEYHLQGYFTEVPHKYSKQMKYSLKKEYKCFVKDSNREKLEIKLYPKRYLPPESCGKVLMPDEEVG